MKKNSLENLAIRVLKRSKNPLTLHQMVDEIKKIDPSVLRGKSPSKSLYSVIYRKEKEREKEGIKNVFSIDKTRTDSVYSLNNDKKNEA